mgnify:FL=1
MANYTKSFNFRNGVQVDTDNFIIDPNGLVGVGTTNPGKLLDVYGSARISGVTSLTNANISGIVTVGSAILIDAASGVITATKFVGSAGDLSGIVAIATDGWIQNVGSLSTTAKLGVGTESEANFAVGNGIEIFDAFNPVLKLSNENTGTTGADGSQVYLKNDGELVIDQKENKDIRFDLNGTQRVKITALGRVGIGSTQPTAELEVAGNANITGISTLGITSATKLEAQQLIVSGVSTLRDMVEIDVDNTANPIVATRYNVDVGGATLFLQHSKTNTVGIAKSLSVNDEVGSIEFRSYPGDDTTICRAARIGAIVDADPTETKVKSALVFETNSAGISGTSDERLRITSAGDVGIGTTNPETLLDVYGDGANGEITAQRKDGASILIQAQANFARFGTNSNDDLQLMTNSDGKITIKTGGNVGIGSTIPQAKLDVRGNVNITSNTHIGTGGTIFATSDAGLIGIGTVQASSDLQIRKTSAVILDVVSDNSSSKIGIGQSVGAGNSSAVFAWDDKVLDIQNNDLGDFNMYLHKGTGIGIDTGSFNWVYGQGNSNLMSLTYGGNLGIGSTNPDETLYVGGDTKITGSLNVEGQITYGSFSLPDPIESKINATSGVSTFSTITVIGGSNNRIGIATEDPRAGLDAKETDAIFGFVGIGTEAVTGNALEVVGTLQATTIQATNNLFATGFTGTPDITVNNITVNGKIDGGDGSGTINVSSLKGDGLGISNIHGYANVRSHGAQGDALNGLGSTDDTTAFQLAIDTGKPVFVPPGSYRIDGTLNLNNGYKQLIGAESIPTLIKMSGTGPIISIGVTETNRNDYSVVENLHLERKIGYLVTIPSYDATPGFVQAGIALTGIGNTSDAIEKTYISNVRVNNFATGFYFRDVSNVKVERCYTEVSDFNTTVGDDEKYSIGYHFDATRFNNTVGMDSPLGGIELFECYDNRNGTPGTAVTATSSTGVGGTVTNSISYYVKGNDIRDVSFTNCKSESAQRGWYVEGTGTDLDWNIHLTRPRVDNFKKNGAEFKNVNGVGAVSINDGYFNGSNYSEKAIFADTCKGLIVGGGTQIVGVSTNNATGVYLNSSDSCSINANRFSNLKNPIYLEASSYNTLDGNVIGASESPGSVGVGTSLADGIILNGDSDRNTISANVIKGLGATMQYYNGIIIGNNADKNSLMGNIVDVDTVTNPIVISGAGNTSLGNIIV